MNKFKSGAKSLFNIAKNAATGVDQSVPEAVVDKRMAECNGCDKLNKTLMQCRECLCFVNFKTKIKQESCPLGKWGKHE